MKDVSRYQKGLKAGDAWVISKSGSFNDAGGGRNSDVFFARAIWHGVSSNSGMLEVVAMGEVRLPSTSMAGIPVHAVQLGNVR
jgi:hypothetical protein